MAERFYQQPILNTPYAAPAAHWKLDESGQPTDELVPSRRRADFVTAVPKPRRQGKAEVQGELPLNEAVGFSTADQRYERTAANVNAIRAKVDAWRRLPADACGVTPTTARLLKHWRDPANFAGGRRPFFCQVEAVEVAVWLAEVCPPKSPLREFIDDSNAFANPGLPRVALKLATGAGKTTVMAMLIAWQTLNAVRTPGSDKFTKGFLVVAPGITVKDRLRVLQPSDPESYYRAHRLVPPDLLADLNRAKVVITNYHAFKRRETLDRSKGNRDLIDGRAEPVDTTETEGQMLARAAGSLVAMSRVMVLNDEAHHCYRPNPAKAAKAAAAKLDADEAAEAKQNAEAARLWVGGLEALGRKVKLTAVYDLSATPFFISGSDYPEGTLFPWTASDFSLMDAIECGIVKLPRIPIDDNELTSAAQLPKFRNLWEHVKKGMPRGSRKATKLTPDTLPPTLDTALDVLYGHYAKTFEAWQRAGIRVPPCFIVVCNNMATSRLVFDAVAGYRTTRADGTGSVTPGRLALFNNFDGYDEPLDRPNTILVDSSQLESGDNAQLDPAFRDAARAEIDAFRAQVRQRDGAGADARFTDAELLRETMNTVGKPGALGAGVRCVVSVAMLTEGWDANTVTHILGLRAFGTQLLCEQVIGRALRRLDYATTDDHGRLGVEYADVFGIPFDFAARAVPSKVVPPPSFTDVRALPERDHLAIDFPRVRGYRVELPDDALDADFTDDSTLVVSPALVDAPTRNVNAGIVGERVMMDLAHLERARETAVFAQLVGHVARRKFADDNAPGAGGGGVLGRLRPVVRRWFDHHLKVAGGAKLSQVLYPHVADLAAEKIFAAVTRRFAAEKPVVAALDPADPVGSTRGTHFRTTATDLYHTANNPPKCHLNACVLDSGWEAEFCRVAEEHPRVLAYVKNHRLGFEVPYTLAGEARAYVPDYILLIDDGRGPSDPLRLVVEVKGYRGEDAKQKAETMTAFWVPGVNRLGTHGRWAFAEFTDGYELHDDLAAVVRERLGEIIDAKVGT